MPIEPAEMVLAALGLAWLADGAGTGVEVGDGCGRLDAVDELDPVRVCGCGRRGGASGPLMLFMFTFKLLLALVLPLLATGGAAVARDKLEGAGCERLRCCC